MAYSAKVMDHFANPRNVGEMKDYSGVGEVGNPKCGDIMRMYHRPGVDAHKGKSIDEALKLTNKAVMEALDGLPPVKVHCSVLAEQAIKAAVADYYRNQGIDPTPIVGELTECEECACDAH